MAEFGVHLDEAQIHRVMSDNVRKTSERMNDYCFRMYALGKQYHLSESAIIHYIRAGLRNRDLQIAIAATKFKTVKEMRETIENYLSNRGKAADIQPKNVSIGKQDQPTSSNTKSSSVTCFNCKEVGHISSKCPKPQRRARCVDCNKVHPRSEPQNCGKRGLEVRRLEASALDECFTKHICVNNVQFKVFIDTGSQCNMVRKSVVESLKTQCEKCQIQLKGFTGGARVIREKCSLVVEIDGISIDAIFYVVDDIMLQTDFLFGQDIITHSSVKLEVCDGQSVFVNKRVIAQSATKHTDVSQLALSLEDDNQREQITSVLKDFKDVFAEGLNGIGKTSLVEMQIEIVGNKVVSQPPYRVPAPKKAAVTQMINELKDNDIIEKSSSEFASPLVVVKKKDGGDRLCVDYRRLKPTCEERELSRAQY